MTTWSNRRQVAAAIAAFLFAISVASFWTVVNEIIDAKELQRTGLKADGVVAGTRNAGATLFLRFSLPDGRQFQFEQYRLHGGYRVGTHLPVRYFQSDPGGSARIDGPGIVAPSMLFIFLGMASFVLTFGALAQAVSDFNMGFQFRR